MILSRIKRLTLPLAVLALAGLAAACSPSNTSGAGWGKTGIKGVESHGNMGGRGHGPW